MSEETLNQLDAETGEPASEAIPLPAPNAPEPMSMGAVLRIVTLRRLWYAQIVSVFGDFLALYAVITVMTYNMHANAQQVTGVQIAYLLPIAILGILSGVFVDRWPVKITLVTSDFIRAGLCLFLLRVHDFYGFYIALAAISVVSSFFSPAQGKAIRGAVPMHGMRSAQALMQQVMFVLRIIGGPIAIVIVSTFTAKACYILDAASFVASGSLIASIALTLPQTSAVLQPVEGKSAVVVTSEKTEKTGIARVLADMKEGTSFIFHHAGLLFVILALAAAMFVMGCFGPLIAIYVRDILHAQGRTFAITSAMIGLGLMAGINILTIAAKKMKNTTLVYFGLTGIAAGTLLLAALPYLAFALIGLFLIGFACGGIIVPSQTMIQQETPQAMLGRVGSTVMSLIFSAQILGLILSGVLASHTSVRRVFFLCTLMLAVLTLIGKLWMEPEEHTPPAAAAA
jgi:MFS family permease